MAAPKGNAYWQRRKKHGKPKAIKDADELWGYFCDYAARVDENPHEVIEEKRGSGSNGQGAYNNDEERVKKLVKPYTWEGFEDYLFEKSVIAHLGDYRDNKDNRYDDYAAIIKHIGRVIYNNKLSGAVIGIFKENIIARDLGLKDKTETELNVKPFNIVDDVTGD